MAAACFGRRVRLSFSCLDKLRGLLTDGSAKVSRCTHRYSSVKAQALVYKELGDPSNVLRYTQVYMYMCGLKAVKRRFHKTSHIFDGCIFHRFIEITLKYVKQKINFVLDYYYYFHLDYLCKLFKTEKKTQNSRLSKGYILTVTIRPLPLPQCFA